jgi:hypothetical protein
MKAFLFALAFAIAVPALAGTTVEVHKKWGVKYASGGMTGEERDALKELAPRFPIHLFFYLEGSQKPIKGVKVTLRDLGGEILLEAESEGPMFLIDSSDGRYTIEANYKGETLTETKDLVGRRYLVLQYAFHADS